MKKLIAMLLIVAVPALADPPADAPVKSPCDDGPADVPGKSACIRSAGDPAPFAGRLESFDTHLSRSAICTRAASFESDVKTGDVVVIAKPTFYSLLISDVAAIVIDLTLGGLAAAHKL